MLTGQFVRHYSCSSGGTSTTDLLEPGNVIAPDLETIYRSLTSFFVITVPVLLDFLLRLFDFFRVKMSLPPSILSVNIFSFLNIEDLKISDLVCRSYYEAGRGQLLWRDLYFGRWPTVKNR